MDRVKALRGQLIKKVTFYQKSMLGPDGGKVKFTTLDPEGKEIVYGNRVLKDKKYYFVPGENNTAQEIDKQFVKIIVKRIQEKGPRQYRQILSDMLQLSQENKGKENFDFRATKKRLHLNRKPFHEVIEQNLNFKETKVC